MKISGAEFRSKSGSHGFGNESNNHFPIRHRLCVQLSRGSCRNYVGFVYGLYLKYSDSELWSPINCRQPVQSWPTSHEDVRGRRVNLSQIYSTHKWMKTRPASRSLSQPARWWISTTFKFIHKPVTSFFAATTSANSSRAGRPLEERRTNESTSLSYRYLLLLDKIIMESVAHTCSLPGPVRRGLGHAPFFAKEISIEPGFMTLIQLHWRARDRRNKHNDFGPGRVRLQ